MQKTLNLYLIVILLGGCASQTGTISGKTTDPENVYHPKYPLYTQRATDKAGDMAYVVERLAKQGGCELYENAQLMAKRPGVQFYRVPCADGRQILYRCEIRRCEAAD